MNGQIRDPKTDCRRKSEIRNPKTERNPNSEDRRPKVEVRWFSFVAWRAAVSDFGFLLLPVCFYIFAAGSLVAQTNLAAEEIPPLLPPRGELPPSFGEQYGLWLIPGGLFALLLVGGVVWFFTRPKPAPVIPAAVEARARLEALRQRREDGTVLVRVSQILRHYLIAAFEMPQEEFTTTEFCQALARVEHVGPDLSTKVTAFLRQCDFRKFAPAASSKEAAGQAVPEAFNIIEQTEARLIQVRQAAVAAPPLLSNG